MSSQPVRVDATAQLKGPSLLYHDKRGRILSKRKWLYIGIVVILALAAFVIGYPKLTEEIAYIRGMQAYVYGFPLVMTDVSNGVMTAAPRAGEFRAPINQFFRMRTFVPADYKDIVRVSRNSLWSGAVLDLDQEPLVVSHPDTSGRYIIIQLMNMWTDDFGSIGSRTTGTGAGSFLVVGPKWNGAPPTDLENVYRCSTRYAWILVQIAAKSEGEYPIVNALQDQLKITPLRAWGTPYVPPDNVPISADADTTATPYDQVRLMSAGTFFSRLAHAMKDNTPYPGDASMLNKLKKLGIEPGKDFDITKIDPHVAKGLNRVPAQIWAAFATAAYGMKTNQGWIQALHQGQFGTDYELRALTAWGGVGALTSDDAIYPFAFVDSVGNPLIGENKYAMHFPKGEIFPSNSGVWSISAYRENYYVPNSIDRYAVTSGMPLHYNFDGSLDIYIQATSPGADKQSNWLPIPPSGPINVMVRVYQPKPEMFNGKAESNIMVGPATYKIPAIQRVD